MISKKFLKLISKQTKKEKRKKAGLTIAMGVVATVGTAIGILFAPKAGKETREDLKKKADDTVETIKDISETLE